MLKRSKPIRRTRLRPVSKKRQRDMREYARLRRELLFKHQICAVWLLANGWIEREVGPELPVMYERPPFRALYPAEHLLAIGAWPSTECHHKAKRGKNYLNASTFFAVSRRGHEKIESQKGWARAVGLLENI